MVVIQKYPELAVDTTDGKPLGEHDNRNQLEELLGLREWLTRLHREVYQMDNAIEELKNEKRKDFLNLAGTTAGIVDELRRLLNDASRSLAVPFDGGPQAKRSMFAIFRRGRKESNDRAVEWLKAMQRSVAAATTSLESAGIHHIELMDIDMRDLEYEGQPLKAWVSAKNKPSGTALVVKEELQGLWVTTLEDQLIPAQRGEVLLK